VGEAAKGSGRLVLVVEDFEDAREMYAEFFRFAGYRVLTAASGIEAMEIIKTQRPDVIVMDISLPQMSGTEVTRAIRSDPATRDIPVLALSAHAGESHSREALEAGVDEYLPKPCPPEELEKRIRALLQKKHKF
jgi:two-component system cell cycle response regulator DivK